jgi:transposase
MGFKPIDLLVKIPRLGCLACGVVRQVGLPFADERVTYTNAFRRFVLELCRFATIQDVAHHLGVGWDLVKDIKKADLARRYSNIPLQDLRQIAIDEICIGKGHRYLTVVMDLYTGAIVHVGDGKGGAALLPFWENLKRSGARIEAVAIDMSPAYINAVQTHLPGVAIIFDHFHVVKDFNERLSDLRREVQREATDVQKKDVLKGTRWLLLKNPENLLDTRGERKRLDDALKLNQPLAIAYYMKEDLRQIWMQRDRASAGLFLNDWIARAQASGITMLNKFANTLAGHRSGILAYYDFRISTGPLEGTNNKIKNLMRQSYGYRDMEFFKLNIYALHEKRYALVG